MPVQSVQAAFPGQNGKVAYGSFTLDIENESFNSGISDINFDGSNQRDLATGSFYGNFDASTRAPRYSADGTKLTYTYENGSYELDIYTMNADGTNQQNVTNLPFDDGRFAMYSSFHPDGEVLTYGELQYDYETSWQGVILTIGEDGSNRQQLTATNSNHCDIYPVFSPDGTKIAFYRGDKNTDTGGIWVMDSDGSNQTQVVEVTATNACAFGSIATIGVGEQGVVSTIDWSPDGEGLVYIKYTTEGDPVEFTSSLRTVDLLGNEEVVYETTAIESNSELGVAGQMLSGVQYIPTGQLIFKELNVVDDEQAEDGLVTTASFKTVSIDGTNMQTITSLSGEGISVVYNLMYGYGTPTVQPLITTEYNGENQAILASAESQAPIVVSTPEGTELTCSSALKESDAAVADASYQYPLGLVDFCFTTEAASNEVSIIFVTNLTPDQVVARKYNTGSNSYYNIPNAVITQTTYQGQSALQVTYTIEDNGVLDLDPVVGQIKDPVGLGLRESETLAATGQNAAVLTMLALMTICGATIYLHRFNK